MRSFARLFVVALAGTRVADTKFVRGTVDTIQAWKYITRFCFTPLPRKARDATEERALKKYGRFDFEVRFPNGARPILALHYNGFNNWDKVYKTDDSCFARINKPGPHMRARISEVHLQLQRRGGKATFGRICQWGAWVFDFIKVAATEMRALRRRVPLDEARRSSKETRRPSIMAAGGDYPTKNPSVLHTSPYAPLPQRARRSAPGRVGSGLNIRAAFDCPISASNRPCLWPGPP